MAIKMAGLNRTRNGRYIARKVLPLDVRDASARLYGSRHEEKLSAPATTSPAIAKEKYPAWLSEVEARIMALRSGTIATSVAKAAASPQELFEQWAAEVKPAPNTIARWGT